MKEWQRVLIFPIFHFFYSGTSFLYLNLLLWKENYKKRVLMVSYPLQKTGKGSNIPEQIDHKTCYPQFFLDFTHLAQ